FSFLRRGMSPNLNLMTLALDVFFTPIYMKKNRPAYRLTVSCKNEDVNTMKDIIFQQTATIGIRMRQEKRFVLKREIIEKETEFGKVHFKRIYFNNEIHDYPEYDDLKAIALKENIPLKAIQEKVK
ncbi:MAG: LarC family nickel insertion protein, partial [Erysipelotrichaceae bacterium]|nr:LarC family nickel insertion protein [Erysipelotrichaceae bacterium]